MARNCVTHKTLLYVQSYGYSDFASDPEFDSVNFEQVTINDTTQLPSGVPRNHTKIVSSAFVEMTQGEKDAVDAAVVPEALVAVVIMPGEETVNSVGWTTVGTVVLDARRYGDVDEMKVEALGMADTTNGAADIRIAWFDGTGNGAFGVEAYDTSGAMEITAYNKQPVIPAIQTEYRLQARKGAATNITMRGWVLTFIPK